MNSEVSVKPNYNQDWEREAENWARWVRTPGHDSFDQFNGEEFFKIIPPAAKATLDIGCGEGRISRRLSDSGHRVVGVDASPTLVNLAAEAHPSGTYLVANASHLPFEDDTFDLAIAHNVLMDVDDMMASVRECARVLVAGGKFCICVTHPINDAGGFANDSDDASFVISGSYFDRRKLEMKIERDNLSMTFHGWCYSLQDYSLALESAGFVIEKIREVIPSAAAIERTPALRRWCRIPMFMHIVARKQD